GAAGSPWSTATLAPLGSPGGASTYLISPWRKIRCSAAGAVVAGAAVFAGSAAALSLWARTVGAPIRSDAMASANTERFMGGLLDVASSEAIHRCDRTRRRHD